MTQTSGHLPMRSITADEYPAFATAVETAFAAEARPEDIALWRRITELDRTVATFDGSRIVATGTADSLQVTVPGGAAVPMAGITAIGTLPTHRRRGLLTRTMRRLLEEARDRGEPLAGLFASEAVIYGRFGFGWAASGLRLTIDRRRAAFSAPPDLRGRMRLLDVTEAREVLPGIYEDARRGCPGMLSRSPARWEWAFHDPEHLREGAGRLFIVADRDRGYARYRIKEAEDPAGPAGTLIVNELVATDDDALAGLWRYLLDVDLVVTVQASLRPVDDPLPLLLADPRQAVAGVSDSLWVRVLDVADALAARTYSADGALVLEVRDDFCPSLAGTFLLEARDGRGRCAPTGAAPHLSLAARDLGAVYLGGVRPSQLARAGRVTEHRPGALAEADRLLLTTPAPWCPFEF